MVVYIATPVASAVGITNQTRPLPHDERALGLE
jgi:hypothetical protein